VLQYVLQYRIEYRIDLSIWDIVSYCLRVIVLQSYTTVLQYYNPTILYNSTTITLQTELTIAIILLYNDIVVTIRLPINDNKKPIKKVKEKY